MDGLLWWRGVSGLLGLLGEGRGRTKAGVVAVYVQEVQELTRVAVTRCGEGEGGLRYHRAYLYAQLKQQTLRSF